MLKLIETENEQNEVEPKSFSDLMNYWKTVEDDTKFLAHLSCLEEDGKHTRESSEEKLILPLGSQDEATKIKKDSKKNRNRQQKITANDVEEIFGLNHTTKSTGSNNVFKKYFTKLFN